MTTKTKTSDDAGYIEFLTFESEACRYLAGWLDEMLEFVEQNEETRDDLALRLASLVLKRKAKEYDAEVRELTKPAEAA